jgi:signal transduction histidine kinase
MRERVVELGGTFQLDASPGQGTRVRILLPAGR